VLGGGVLWGGSVFLLLFAFVRARRRGRRILAQWAAEDARADAREASNRNADERMHGNEMVSSHPPAGIIVYLPNAQRYANELPDK
jgi:hypothetical protein